MTAVELAAEGGPSVVDRVADEPVLDRAALRAYRLRLADLDDELAAAEAGADLARRQRAGDERERLLAEVRRATRPAGAARTLGPTAAERARKAVTARIRDAIRRIGAVLPDLGTHLDRTVRTGHACRYDDEPVVTDHVAEDFDIHLTSAEAINGGVDDAALSTPEHDLMFVLGGTYGDEHSRVWGRTGS